MSQSRRIARIALPALVLMLIGGCQVHPNVMRDKGNFYYERGEYDQAKPWYEQLADARPTDWQAHHRLGVIALSENNTAEARRHLELAYTLIEDKKRQAEPVVDALAEAIFRQKEYTHLFGLLDEAVDRYGAVHDYIRKGSYLYQYGDHDAALIAYRQGAKIAKSGDLSPYETLGDFYASIGDSKRAIAEYRRAYTIDPKNKNIREKLLKLGIVPGPTILLAPEQLPTE